MHRDSLFYQLFQQYPALLFELLSDPPANAAEYLFESVAVKEPRFEIDGVFLPPETPGIVYFCEVQMQKDERLYERLFAESLLYFYRNRDRFSNWQTIVIYPTRRVEQSDIDPYLSLLTSEQVQRVYLDELGDIRQLPLSLSLLLLTTVSPERAASEARYLLSREGTDLPQFSSRTLVELVTTIMVYRYEGKSQREVEEMLGITLQETRVYQEIKEESERSLILRLLTRKVGELPSADRDLIESLPLAPLEALGEALLDFESLGDLQAWLATQPTASETE